MLKASCLKSAHYESGLKKQQSDHLEQVIKTCKYTVDCPARQVTFNCHCPDGQEPRQDVCQLNFKNIKIRTSNV